MKKINYKFSLLLVLLVSFFIVRWHPIPDFFSQPKQLVENEKVDTTEDMLLFWEKQKLATADTSTVTRALAVAKSFLGAPYVHGCLDRNEEEDLIVNLRELDCWTFVENSLAIALSYNGNYGLYQTHLRQLRYWNGKVEGYGSRIHYLTGWLLQAEECGILQDITVSLGGIPYKKKVGYITARPSQYPKTSDKKVLLDLQSAEKRINEHNWYYIPIKHIAKMEHLIQEGDIIGLTSVKPDLDVTHQGIAVRLKNHIYLLHASSIAGKVIISKEPLIQYVSIKRGQSGIIVARLQ